MMDYTDIHFRHLVRLISQETLLYTEMISANAIAYERLEQKSKSSQSQQENDQQTSSDDFYYLHRYLGQSQGAAATTTPSSASHRTFEGPCVLQLGGSDPELLRQASATVLEMTGAAAAGSSSSSSSSSSPSICDYTAINLNCGCPSPKVAGKGCFGAALMHEPQLVKELTSALSEGCQGRFPITVKCRIGTDDDDADTQNSNGLSFGKENYFSQNNEEKEYARLCHFIETVAAGGVVTDFAIHARIAVLKKSYSPADNRKIPPLKYHFVHRLIHDFPHLTFTLNGGIETLTQVDGQLKSMPGLQGVMVGRAWAADPWGFAMADSLLYHDSNNDYDYNNDIDASRQLQAPAKTKINNNKNRLQILQAYGRYADAQEAAEQVRAMETGHYPQGIRRFLVKAVSHLFAGEANAKRFRVALDDIAIQQSAFIKKTKQTSHANGILISTSAATSSTIPPGPSFSEQLINIAMQNLSEDALLETALQSHERRVAEEQHRRERGHQQLYSAPSLPSSTSSTSASISSNSDIQSSDTMSRVQEWQQERRFLKQQSSD
jgi:tRNA-dihydrouridine synthase A